MIYRFSKMIIKTIVYFTVLSIIRNHNGYFSLDFQKIGLGTYIHHRLLVSLMLLLNTSILLSTPDYDINDISLSTVEIIEKNGYVCKTYTVTTEDGYILELHRIPSNKEHEISTKHYPVFIHHGVLGSSADWVIGGEKMSLPMQLADFGYDVWLANCRGNIYSRKHKNLPINQKEFWDFSFHEIGKYDLPASIDFIIDETKATQVQYIGYSMATTAFFIMASEKPKYQQKIRSQISLAPIASLYNTKSIIKHLAPQAQLFNNAAQILTNGMIGQQPWAKILKLSDNFVWEKLILFSVCGFDPELFKSKLIPYILGHMPAGTSSKLIEHFAQFMIKSDFSQFDYGIFENLMHYKSITPPLYRLDSIKVPITLIYGLGDTLADFRDVMNLRKQLPNILYDIRVKNLYNHLDFLYSLTVSKDINVPIKNILDETDDTNWNYSKPNSKINNDIDIKYSEDGHNISNYVTGLDNFEENLDMIVENIIPHILSGNNKELFKPDIIKQFKELIHFMKTNGGYKKNDLQDPMITYKNIMLWFSFFNPISS